MDADLARFILAANVFAAFVEVGGVFFDDGGVVCRHFGDRVEGFAKKS